MTDKTYKLPKWFKSARDWAVDRFVIIVLVIVLAVVLVCAGVAIYLAYQESLNCAAAGGRMVTTGYTPILQKVGSVFVTNNIPIQECRVG